MPQPQRGKASRMSSLNWLSHTTFLPSLDTQTAHLEAKLLTARCCISHVEPGAALKQLNFFNTGLTNGPRGSGFPSRGEAPRMTSLIRLLHNKLPPELGKQAAHLEADLFFCEERQLAGTFGSAPKTFNERARFSGRRSFF